MLIDKSLNKAEYYRSNCQEMEQKYRADFADFKKKVEESEEEIFSEWDDLMIWEGYHLGYREWLKRYTDPLLFFLPQTHTDAHRQISESGIRHICKKYAVKNRKWITI